MIEGMERLLDENDKFGHLEATALGNLGKAIVETAKAEFMVAKLAGAKHLGSDFIEVREVEEKPMMQLSPKQFDKLG